MKDCWNPLHWIKIMHALRLFHFGFVGGTTFIMHIGLTIVFEKLFFGKENWYLGYTLALAISLVYNFIMHTIVTYRTKDNHLKRFATFVICTIIINILQNIVVKALIDLFGPNLRYLIMALVIMIQSALTFLVFRLWLFKETKKSRKHKK